MKILILDKYSYQTFPIVEGMIEVPEAIMNLIGSQLKFDKTTNSVVAMTSEEVKEMSGE